MKNTLYNGLYIPHDYTPIPSNVPGTNFSMIPPIACQSFSNNSSSNNSSGFGPSVILNLSGNESKKDLAFLPQAGAAIGMGTKIYLNSKADDLLLDYGNEKQREKEALKIPQRHDANYGGNTIIALNDLSNWTIK